MPRDGPAGSVSQRFWGGSKHMAVASVVSELCWVTGRVTPAMDGVRSEFTGCDGLGGLTPGLIVPIKSLLKPSKRKRILETGCTTMQRH